MLGNSADDTASGKWGGVGWIAGGAGGARNRGVSWATASSPTNLFSKSCFKLVICICDSFEIHRISQSNR